MSKFKDNWTLYLDDLVENILEFEFNSKEDSDRFKEELVNRALILYKKYIYEYKTFKSFLLSVEVNILAHQLIKNYE